MFQWPKANPKNSKIKHHMTDTHTHTQIYMYNTIVIQKSLEHAYKYKSHYKDKLHKL